MRQDSNQCYRRLAVVYGTADNESQQALEFMVCRKRAGIKQLGIGLDVHQK
jgi:hypothetical protein